MALLDCAINGKCCSVDGGRDIYPLFSSPPWGFDIQGKNKNMLMPGGQPGRGGGGGAGHGRSWNWLMHKYSLT